MSAAASSPARIFYTPAEVAAELTPAISEFTIIQKVRAKEIECSRGSKKAILFTRQQINMLVDSMRQPAEPKQAAAPDHVALVHEEPNIFGATDRSHQRTRRSQAASA